MLRLLPHPAIAVDPLELYPALARPAPPGRPWVMASMISSADGAIIVDGTSEALSNPADQAVFSAIRACADWIVVAAGTVRAELYGLPRPKSAVQKMRAAMGQSERPRLAVVSTSLDFPHDLPMLADQRTGEDLPVIFTGRDAPADAVGRFQGMAEVLQSSSQRPSTAEILAELGRRGAEVILCEGGPSFNAQFADAGTIDEVCLSIAPLLVCGPSPRMIHGSHRPTPLRMDLDHLLEADGTLFARYLVNIQPDASSSFTA